MDDVNLGLQHFYGEFNVTHARLVSSGVSTHFFAWDADCVGAISPIRPDL